VDVRVKTMAEWERISSAIGALQPVLPGARLIVEGELNRPPMEKSPVTLEPFRRAQEIAAAMGLLLTADGTGGASDANFTAAMGVPTLDGLGAVGDGAHSVDEYVLIPSLPERAALLAALLTAW
jgi:glutamate carboxypeptidase